MVPCAALQYLIYSFLSFPANCASVIQANRVVFDSVAASLNPAHSFVIRSVCPSRKGCPRELVHSPSYLRWALELGRISLMIARPLEYYYSSQI